MRAPAFWRERGAPALVLSPLGVLWDLGGRLRRRTAAPYAADIPVLCVGNLTIGGAGKTPVALSLGRALKARDITVGFLSRGHGGSAQGTLRVDPKSHAATEVGDEPLLLARVAPTWISRDRAAGAQAMENAGIQAIVMDDGFQNPTLAKTLSLLVVDGETGLGNGLVFPAGPLRESARAGFARADAVVLIGEDRTGLRDRLPAAMPLLRAATRPDAATKALAGRRLFAFAGIARPSKLFESLRGLGVDLAGTAEFADHQPYGARELASLRAKARKLGADLVTTEKDWVRLPQAERADIAHADIELVWADPAARDALLDRLLASSSGKQIGGTAA